MKTKQITSLIMCAFALVFCLSLASALTLTPSTTTLSAAQGDASVSFNFNISNNNAFNYTSITFNSTSTKGTWSFSSPTLPILTGNTQTLTATLPLDPNFYGVIISTINVNVTDGVTNASDQITPITVTVTANPNSFCPINSSSSDLELEVSVNNKGEGDESGWQPLDNIEVKVKLSNDRDSDGEGDYDLSDVVFKLILLNDAGKDVAEDLIWNDSDANEASVGDIDEGDSLTYTFKFRVNPEEITSGDYTLMVQAYPDGDDDKTCISFSEDFKDVGDANSEYYAKIAVEGETSKSKMVVPDLGSLSLPLPASCNQDVSLTTDIWNIGEGDNSDFSDQIQVDLYNKVLGVNLSQTISGDLSGGDKTSATFDFKIPEGLDEKVYSLEMKIRYNWDSDDQKYKTVSSTTYLIPVKVSGNCIVPQATLNASLVEGASAGGNMTIKAVVSNTGKQTTNYTLNVAGYESWASNANYTKTLTLNANQSSDVLITFSVKKDAEDGAKTFTIETFSDGKLISSQPVQVTVEPKKGFSLSNNNAPVAILIALIAIIALVIIIVLIVRASKK